MGKTTIRVDCVDQRLYITENPIIASGGVNEDAVEFNFCPLWEGFGKTAVFFCTASEPYTVVVTDDRCVIPSEVLADKGEFYFGVFGLKDDITRTSEVIGYSVVSGVPLTGSQTATPTPDVYSQIMTALGELGGQISNSVRRSGDTMTGNLTVQSDQALGEVRVNASHGAVALSVENGRGLYDYTSGKWAASAEKGSKDWTFHGKAEGLTGALDFGQTMNGLVWTTADGTRFCVRPYTNGNLFQITRQPPGGAEENAFSIDKDGNLDFGGDPLPLHLGGTQATNAIEARAELEVPSISEHIAVRDRTHIEEEGRSDGWYYRKWSNGYCELSGKFQIDYETASAWGSVYFADIPSRPFPFPLVDLLAGNANIQDHNTWCVSNMSSLGDTGQLYAITAEPLAVTAAVHYNIVGLWK